MGNLTIEFRGICTQIKLPDAIDGVLHRTVLVRWDQEQLLMPYAKVIPPHISSLTIRGGIEEQHVTDLETASALISTEPGSWQLAGVRLSVDGSVGDSVTYTQSSFSVPSLTTLAPNFGELSRTRVFGSDANCHFDIRSGSFRGIRFEPVIGSWYTFVDVPTEEDNPRVLIQQLGETSVQGWIRLMPGAVVSIDNTAPPGQDKSWDFYLHYLTAQIPPTDATLPPEVTQEVEVIDEGRKGSEIDVHAMSAFEIGPGCSNSNYP